MSIKRIKRKIAEQITEIKIKFNMLKTSIKNYFLSRKIKNNSKLQLYSINKLAEDIPLITNEIYKPNDFYGHAAILKKYAGYKKNYQIKGSIEHGPHFNDNYSWEKDIGVNLPTIFTQSNKRAFLLQKKFDKHCIALGPYINYVNHIFSEKKLNCEKKRLGNNLLVFPAHSTHHVDTNYNLQDFYKKIKNISSDFDTVRICFYWKDILRGTHHIFKSYGFECVTAGHIFDPNFLPRLKSIIETSTVTVSNLIGTHIGYSIFMGKPHYYFNQSIDYSGNLDDLETLPDNIINKIAKSFNKLDNDITQEQLEVVNYYWGLEDIKTRQEMKEIFELTESLYKQQEKQEVC